MKKTVIAVLYILAAYGMYSQDVLTPIELKIPSKIIEGAMTVDEARTQVQQVICGLDYVHESIRFKEKPGENFSLTLWFAVSNPALLKTSVWDQKTPMTVVEVSDNDGWERMLVRLQQGQIVVVASNDGGGKWQSLGTKTKIEAGKWYLLTVVRAKGRTAAYLNNSFIGESGKLPALKGVNKITYGRFDQQRFLYGAIMEPRVYKGVLKRLQIRDIFLKQKPEAIPEGSVGRAEVN